MSDATTALTDERFMAAFLDLAIPPNAAGGVPGAGALGLAPAVMRGLQADPMLGPMVRVAQESIRSAAAGEHADGLVGMTPEAGGQLLQTQLAGQPFVMMGVLRYLYPAYYQHPKVLQAIGRPPRPPFPEGFEVTPTDPELMAKLEARRSVD